jgi:hypothetical protein
MSKFNKGDRVKVVSQSAMDGKEGIVNYVYEDYDAYQVLLDGSATASGFFENELAPVGTVRLKIEVQGSEDESYVSEDWTPEEMATLVKFAKLVNKDAQSGLQPRIEIERDGEKIVKWDD